MKAIKNKKVVLVGVLVLIAAVVLFGVYYFGDPGDPGYFSVEFQTGANDITFSTDIFLYNSQISEDNTCENFCQVGGIWDEIQSINDLNTLDSWIKGEPWNPLTHIVAGIPYSFYVSSDCTLYFEYDLK